ncbi:MAG: protein BatD [Flavobacteriales bacterium]|nr:protein BatD [Flavobacteriales bacterium]
MMQYARSLMLVAFLMGAAGLSAQEISFTATVDRNSIAVGEHIRLTLTLTNGGDRFDAPDLGRLVVVGGPQYGSRMSNINGRMSTAVTKTWIITATAPGKYVIGPAKATIARGSIATQPITIEVVKGAAGGDANAAQQQRANANIFCTVDLSKSKAMVGEQVLVSYTLYSRYGSLEPVAYDIPPLNGFWSEEIELGNITLDNVVAVNGIEYYKAVIKRQLLIPQRPGRLRIEAAKLTYRANVNWFGQGTKVEVVTNPVDFTALALPAGAPADFNGAVGELKLEATADRSSVTTDEAIEIRVRLSGRSNLKLLDAPKLGFPGDFETYDPKVVDRIAVTAAGMSGSREFQYTVIPRHEGRFELGPIGFSYYDPQAGAYRSLRSDPLTIEVAQGSGGGGAMVPRTSKSDVLMLDADVRYIRSGDLELRPKGRFLFWSWPWFAGMSVPALAFVLFVAWYRKHERESADEQGTRRRRADRVARQRLREAGTALQSGERAAFYSALSRALHGYLSDKFALGVAEVNTHELRERFAPFHGGQALAEDCARLLAACDMARFAPVEDRPRKELYEEAADLIQRIERTARA